VMSTHPSLPDPSSEGPVFAYYGVDIRSNVIRCFILAGDGRRVADTDSTRCRNVFAWTHEMYPAARRLPGDGTCPACLDPTSIVCVTKSGRVVLTCGHDHTPAEWSQD